MADFRKSADWAITVEDEIGMCVPPDCQVVFYNDDFTTKDFVVGVLVSVYHKAERDALVLMETVHREGSAVVGTYTYDIAQTRAQITVRRARDEGFPLRVEVVTLR